MKNNIKYATIVTQCEFCGKKVKLKLIENHELEHLRKQLIYLPKDIWQHVIFDYIGYKEQSSVIELNKSLYRTAVGPDSLLNESCEIEVDYNIKSLNLENYEDQYGDINDEFINKFTNLRQLILGSANSDLSSINNLIDLEYLDLGKNEIRNIDIEKLVNLKYLKCYPSWNLEFLNKLTNLTSLTLNLCKLVIINRKHYDFSPLGKLVNLETLTIIGMRPPAYRKTFVDITLCNVNKNSIKWVKMSNTKYHRKDIISKVSNFTF